MKDFLHRRIAPLLPAALLSYALAWSAHLALFIAQALPARALTVLALTALFMLWTRSRKTFALGAGMLAAAALILWLILGNALWAISWEFLTQAFGFLCGKGRVEARFVSALTLTSTALVTGLVVALGRIGSGFAAPFSFASGLLLTEWLFGHTQILPAVLPAATALLMMLAGSYQRRIGRMYHRETPVHPMALWTLPMALLIVASAYLCLMGRSTAQWKWEGLSKRIEIINDYLSDYTGFTRPRNAFSLAVTGFSPHSGRLGGPVTLDSTPVLWVAADRTILLRGNTYNHYESTRWTDTTGSCRYRINAQASQSALEDAFDLNRPDPALLEDGALKDFLIETDVTVVHLTYGPSSMFTPFRVTSVTPTKRFDLLVYFNDKGDVFTTRDLNVGSGYTIHALLPDYEDPGFSDLMARLLEAAVSDSPDRAERIRSLYTGLPDTVSRAVYDTAERVTAGALNDYDKMKRIQDYLASSFHYTLAPADPPDSDFVSWFFESGEGYCTYYASAMAVMARIAGLPSRYVEGFRAIPNRRGECTVTNQDAHAWVEIYFDGIGWIPFDPTPSASAYRGDPVSGSETGGDAVPDVTRAPAAGSEPVLPSGRDDTGLSPIAAACLAAAGALLLLLAALAGMSRLRTALPVVRRFRPTPQGQVRFLFGDILALLSLCNDPTGTGETLSAYAARIDRWLTAEGLSLGPVADIAIRMTYSRRVPTSGEVEAVAWFRRRLSRVALRAAGPFRYFLARVICLPWRSRWP